MTVERSYDADDIRRVMDETEALKHVYGDIKNWLADDKNVALKTEGGYGLFEYGYPGVYTGHYFLRVRGKKAYECSVEALKYFFDNYPVTVIRGFTPHYHKGALWMNRQLGCKTQGSVDTIAGPCDIVTLTKEDFQEGLI